MNTIAHSALKSIRISFFCMIGLTSVTAMAMQQLSPLDPDGADFSGMFINEPNENITIPTTNFIEAYNNLISEFNQTLVKAAIHEDNIIDKVMNVSLQQGITPRFRLPMSITQQDIDNDLFLRRRLIQVLQNNNKYVNSCIEHHIEYMHMPVDLSSPTMMAKTLNRLTVLNKIAFACTALDAAVNL